MSGIIPAETNLKPHCVRCKWDDKQKTDPLLKPCLCNDDYKNYHYQCLCDLIVETLDAPCRGCDHHFEDARIVRDPSQYLKFLLQCPHEHMWGSISLAIGLIVFLFFGLREWSRSYGILCPIHNYPRPATVGLVGIVLAIWILFCGLYIRGQYQKWFQTQDRIVLFYGWKNSSNVYQLNVSHERRKRGQKFGSKAKQ